MAGSTDTQLMKLKRLKEALESINSGKLHPVSCPPTEREEHRIGYNRREYATIVIDPEGRVHLQPAPEVSLTQIELVLNICETLLQAACD